MSNVTQDANTSKSTHQTQVAGKSVSPTTVAGGHALQVRGDFAVWDSVSNKFVLVDQTQFGTTVAPKNQ